VFNGEELLSKEEFCIQPDGRGISAPGREEALLCSILFTVQGVFNGEELLSEEEFCIQPDGRGSSAPGREEALLCSKEHSNILEYDNNSLNAGLDLKTIQHKNKNNLLTKFCFNFTAKFKLHEAVSIVDPDLVGSGTLWSWSDPGYGIILLDPAVSGSKSETLFLALGFNSFI